MIFNCPHCGLKAAPGRTDCGSCGRVMTRACTACAEPVAATSTACKYCGEDLSPLREAAPPKGKVAEDVRFLEEPVVSPVCAWEDRSKGLLRRWWGTWAQSNFSPKAFFRGLKPDSGHSWPVGYAFGLTAQFLALIVLAMVAGLGVFAYYGVDLEPLARRLTHEGVPTSGAELRQVLPWSPLAVAAVGIPAAFLGVTILLYVSSLFWHLLLKVLGGKGGFQSTLRVVGYGSGAAAWLLIPIVGAVLAPLMQTAMYYQGFRELHGLSRFKAALAILVPLLLAAGAGMWAFSHGYIPCCPAQQADYHGTF